MKKALPTAILASLLMACWTGGSTADRAATLPPATVATTTPESTTSTQALATTTQMPTTTMLVGGLPEALPGALETVLKEDLIFHQGDERFDESSGKMDVIAPTVEGPWPTVVVFHGADEIKTWHRPDATMLAEQGRVVFLPNWMWIDWDFWADNGTRAGWELMVQEATCAVIYAKAHAAQYGGDPDHITVYGYSAGSNGALMASFAEATPIEACSAPGSAVIPQAVVAIDTDWMIAPPIWDEDLSGDPEMFYSFTPYRYLNGSQDIPIHVMTTEETTVYKRAVSNDPAKSWFTYRHTDVDLAAELEELGFLDDGYVDLQEFAGYGHFALASLGYETTLTVMPNSSHAWWSDEARAAVVERVLHAEQAGS